MAVIVNWGSFSCKDKDRDRQEYCFQEKKDEGIQVKTCGSFSVVSSDRIGAFYQKIIINSICIASLSFIWIVELLYYQFNSIWCTASLMKTKLGLYMLNSLEVDLMNSLEFDLIIINQNNWFRCFLFPFWMKPSYPTTTIPIVLPPTSEKFIASKIVILQACWILRNKYTFVCFLCIMGAIW